ncbi:MAG: hypothetical protein IKG11_06435 [Atopobiaceae bacterium]|nr:hypothetical protein [Atopobiaceae bacterium]
MKRCATGLAVLLMVVSVLVLAACGSGATTDQKTTDQQDNVYRVLALDEAGSPVQGVKMQLCSDTICYALETDANGVATFKDVIEGSYAVHVRGVPEGYAQDDTEYPVPSGQRDITITIKAEQ